MTQDTEKEKIILGIDPGTNLMGYGIIRVGGSKCSLVTLGVVHLHKYKDHSEKLKQIFVKTTAVIERYKPQEMAIEAPFYGKNIQSMLKLGRAQGICLAAALAKDLPVFEYAPKKIKQAVTGKGTAGKEQVAAMLQHILKEPIDQQSMDATDALAAALCHWFQKSGAGNSSFGKKKNSWSAFIQSNPERLK